MTRTAEPMDRPLAGRRVLVTGAAGGIGAAAVSVFLRGADPGGRHDRAVPGDGEFPLAEILSLLPPEVTVSAEVPLRRLERLGVSPEDRARRILDGSRRLMAGVRPWKRSAPGGLGASRPTSAQGAAAEPCVGGNGRCPNRSCTTR
ncbi:hypothetical protein [Streptomyces sp. NPDC101234]|uniref:hypothetical protein n=1 Tax=Streptomyces sp. NPDC101234 TaxID=3366138 RepID=UPI00382BB510